MALCLSYPAYVPGRTARPPEDTFLDLRKSVTVEMMEDELAASPAWRAGWQFYGAGYFWEAHEVWEPVWMQLPPNSAARHVVQAVIQLANAELKIKMGRLQAAQRLCTLVREHIDRTGGERAMGLCSDDLVALVEKVEKRLTISAK